MNFLDGVMLASCFWFFICLVCFMRGIEYGWNDFDIPRFNWTDGFSDGWDSGYKCGIDIGLDHGYDAGFQAGLEGAGGVDHDHDQRQNT